MKLYTNKHPVIEGFPILKADNTLDGSEVKVRFETGKIFKVVGCTETTIFVKCRGVILGFNVDMFNMLFEETEVDLDE